MQSPFVSETSCGAMTWWHDIHAGLARCISICWRTEIERDPNVSLSIAGRDYPVRVSAVSMGTLYDRVNAAYTEKYGMMSDALLAMWRPFGGAWRIYQAEGR